MPLYNDWTLARFEDGAFIVNAVPEVNVGGWSLQFTLTKRFGPSPPLVTRSCASGYGGGESGVTVLNSGLGIFSVLPPTPAEMSGMPAGNYAYQCERTDSGGRVVLTQGYLILTPSNRQG